MEKQQINKIQALTQILQRNRVPSICARGRAPQLLKELPNYGTKYIGAKVFLDGQWMGSLDLTPSGKVGFYVTNRKDILEKTLNSKFPQDYQIEF